MKKGLERWELLEVKENVSDHLLAEKRKVISHRWSLSREQCSPSRGRVANDLTRQISKTWVPPLLNSLFGQWCHLSTWHTSDGFSALLTAVGRIRRFCLLVWDTSECQEQKNRISQSRLLAMNRYIDDVRSRARMKWNGCLSNASCTILDK